MQHRSIIIVQHRIIVSIESEFIIDTLGSKHYKIGCPTTTDVRPCFSFDFGGIFRLWAQVRAKGECR